MDFESSENGSPLNHSTRIEPNKNVSQEEMDLAGKKILLKRSLVSTVNHDLCEVCIYVYSLPIPLY